jgi:D-arabinose 5-phosphate isomerase GutQ
MIAYFGRQIKTVMESFETLPQAYFDELSAGCAAVLKNGGKIIASGLGKTCLYAKNSRGYNDA